MQCDLNTSSKQTQAVLALHYFLLCWQEWDAGVLWVCEFNILWQLIYLGVKTFKLGAQLGLSGMSGWQSQFMLLYLPDIKSHEKTNQTVFGV